MSAAKYWLRAITVDIVMAALFAAWKLHGIEGAGNVFTAVLWFSIVVGILCGVLGDKSFFKTERPKGFANYHVATEFAMFAALAWFGHFWLASLRICASIGIEMARDREPKEKKA